MPVLPKVLGSILIACQKERDILCCRTCMQKTSSSPFLLSSPIGPGGIRKEDFSVADEDDLCCGHLLQWLWVTMLMHS